MAGSVAGEWTPAPTFQHAEAQQGRREWRLPGLASPSFLAVLGLCLFVFLYVPAQTGNTYLSDDLSSFISVKHFAETGKLYFEDPLIAADEENLMHPRGFVTHEGRAVPYNFLGLPVIYGSLYWLVGDAAEYFGAVLGVLAIASLWGILGILLPEKRGWAFPLVLLVTPLLYYLGRPYMNMVPAIAFALAGSYLLLRYRQRPSGPRIAAASAVFALGIFCRYPDIAFIAPLVALVVWQARGSLRSVLFLRDLAIFGMTIGIVFGIPVLVLNQLTYGEPFVYGYSLFNDAYYPTRGGADAGGIPGIFGRLSVMALPGGVDPAMLWASIWKYFFVLTPLLLTLGLAGYVQVLRRRALPLKFTLAYTALFAYIVLYQGSGAVWGTQFGDPTLGHTMVRYWIPAYVLLMLLGAYAVSRFRSMVVVGAVAGIAIWAGLTGLFSGKESLTEVKDAINFGDAEIQRTVVRYTEPDAVIYAGRSDKFLVGHRRVAAWFNSASKSFFDARQVASSMNRVQGQGIPVYIVHDRDANLKALAAELRPYGLGLELSGEGALSRVVPAGPATGSQGAKP